MNYYLFPLFFLFKFIFTKDSSEYFNLFDDMKDNYYRYILTNITKRIGIDKESFFNDSRLSQECKVKLNDSIFEQEKSFLYYNKIFYDSAINKNDIRSYFNCINNPIVLYNYNKKNEEIFNYLTVLINEKKSLYSLITTKEGSSSYLIGLCIFDGCNRNDYQIIILKIMYYLNLINSTDNVNDSINNKTIIDINDEKSANLEIKIYSMDNTKSSGFITFLKYIPFIIILVHIFLILFKNFPIHLYNFIIYLICCKPDYRILIKSNTKKSRYSLKNKEKNIDKIYKPVDSDRNPSSISLISNTDFFKKSLDLLYNIDKNFSSLVEYKQPSKIINDSGLSYINGIKGISMIFLLFGSVYNDLYDSIIIEKDKELFYCQLKNIFFSIFYIGIKYAPKLLLCSSGFSLIFKFICFLDGKLEKEEEINRQNEESDEGKEINILREGSGISNSNSFYKKLRKGGKEMINKNHLLSFKYLLIFFVKQLHKYLVYILFICFFLFSLNGLVLKFQFPGPIWNFYNEGMVNSVLNVKYIMPLLIGYKTYFFKEIIYENENILDYLYLVFQEIFYFSFTTIIIFIGYKFNLRMDRFFKIIFILLIIFRIVFYIIKKLDDKDYFGYKEFGKFYASLLYNYTFYIIGIHYGLINYVIQKGYTFRECDQQNKIYLINALHSFKSLKRKTKYYLCILSFIFFCILIFISFLQQIIISFYDLDSIMNNYKKNAFTQILMLIDADIFVFAINSMALCLYIKRDNLINDILSHNFWSIFNRFYFSYILIINPFILYIIYANETKIIFNISNCLLYSFICGILIFPISILVYIIFELPLKKIINFWINLGEKKDIKGRLSHLGGAYSYTQDQNFIDSATVSITDYVVDEEEDEEG